MLEVKIYDEKDEKAWDRFVEEDAVNGTFLQTRRFLNYHPAERFQDNSCIVVNEKKQIIAVVPACIEYEDGDKVLYSHLGSTYGGVIVGRKWYKASKVIEIIQALEKHWCLMGVRKVVLKQTPSLLAVENADLMQYCFYYLGFQCCNELNLYIDLKKYSEDILSEFSQGKRTDVHNCIKKGLSYRKISSFEEIEKLHALLQTTLSKYGKKPIHTVAEIYDFQSSRLHNECECFGAFDENEMVAASMMFYFNQVNVAHAQYLCADPEYNRLSSMTFMYYAMLTEMRVRGFEKVSWGIATEDQGRYLNEGLVKSKEYYGSKHSVNQIFAKVLKN